jgi:uncharacterized Zn finger protein
MGRNDFGGWAPYVPVAQRQRQARQEIAALNKKGQSCQPVVVEGRTIARSFWGKAWCDNLESYSDYANRLPRGRSYLRNGSVIDLRIEPGKVLALVSGSDIYRIEIAVQPLAATRWRAIVKECSGQVASVIELLQGRLSGAVMAAVTRPGEGLFPQPRQIILRCSCPDSASMCKHVAAALYGVGARLDSEPELLFRLRQTDPLELIREAGKGSLAAQADEKDALDGADLSALFGIELGDAAATPAASQPSMPRKAEAPPPIVPPKEGVTKAVRGKRARRKTVTASELIERGVARHMIQNWIVRGILLRTDQRGVYGTTAQTETPIAAYTARGLNR